MTRNDRSWRAVATTMLALLLVLALLLLIAVFVGVTAGVARAGQTTAGDEDGIVRVRARVTLAQRFAAVRALERQTDAFAQRIAVMERSARSFRAFIRCVSLVGVNQYGDPDHGYGYEYDDVDGAGADLRPALARNGDPRRWPDFALLDFAERDECQSATTVPGGTADPAEAPPTSQFAPPPPSPRPPTMVPFAWPRSAPATKHARVSARPPAPPRRTLAARTHTVRTQLVQLHRREARLEEMAERFDEWESCLSWVPVTEYGDPDGMFGYVQRLTDGTLAGYRSAIAVDSSEWDDPDYEFLAFVGRDRPFTDRECGNEPGESVD